LIHEKHPGTSEKAFPTGGWKVDGCVFRGYLERREGTSVGGGDPEHAGFALERGLPKRNTFCGKDTIGGNGGSGVWLRYLTKKSPIRSRLA